MNIQSCMQSILQIHEINLKSLQMNIIDYSDRFLATQNVSEMGNLFCVG